MIYDYHHYHSNTHESLVIIQGTCQVQIGGKKGSIYEVAQGDVIIFPAGVSHKNVDSSPDFKCIGSYPTHKEYDIKYGKADEHPEVDENINNVEYQKVIQYMENRVSYLTIGNKNNVQIRTYAFKRRRQISHGHFNFPYKY